MKIIFLRVYTNKKQVMPRREYKYKHKAYAAKWAAKKFSEFVPGAAGAGYAYSQYQKGGAAPLSGKNTGFKLRQRKQRAERKKCKKLSGYALKKEVCQLKNAVKDLKHSEAASLATLTYRKIRSDRELAVETQQNAGVKNIVTTTNLETVINELLYYDPSNPTVLINADGALGSYQKNFLFKSISSKLRLRNNYQSDCEVTVYICTPKKDSSTNPTSAWTAGINDDPGSIGSFTEYGAYPTDTETFRDLWSAKRVAIKTLSPGQSCEVSHSVSDVNYDPAITDTIVSIFQRSIKSCVWLYVVKGCLSHDTVANEQGISACGVDVQQSDTYKVSYDAGVNLSYTIIDDTMNSASNAFVQSHQPAPDNVGYSVD